jgi:hypothetical protein
MQGRHGGEAILVQGPVPPTSPFYPQRDQATGWLADKAERRRLNFVDGRSVLAHRRDGTVKTAARHLRDKNDAAFFHTHGLICARDFENVFCGRVRVRGGGHGSLILMSEGGKSKAMVTVHLSSEEWWRRWKCYSIHLSL